MSADIVINVEPEEDEEVEQTEEPNDDEGGEQEENSVGDEEENEPPSKLHKLKPRFYPAPWICFFGVLLVIGGAIALGIYFGRPNCYPVQNYAFLEDQFTVPGAKRGYKISLFSGQVTHERMFSICDRIHVLSRRGYSIKYIESKGTLYLNKADEKNIDTIIKENEKQIFNNAGGKKLMWTGYYYMWARHNITWEAKLPVDGYRNFCNGDDWSEEDLEKKGESLDKTTGKIYVVKNYDKDDACWELYTAKELAKITGQPVGMSPRLSFACSFGNNNIASGKDAVPGHFTPKYTVGNYTFYNVSATIEDAKKECEAHNSKLIQFKDLADMNALFDLRNDIHKDSSELYWSGVYMDVSNGNNRSLTLSPTWNHKFDPSEKSWSETGLFLERAAEKLIASLKSNKPRDCASHYVYAGISTPLERLTDSELIQLLPINDKGQLDQDSFTAYVACETN